MTVSQRLAALTESVFSDGGWIEVSPRGLFVSLTAEEAAAHPIEGAHSAWEIALHLAFWHDAVRRRLQGETVEYAPEEDWPVPPRPAESNWQAMLVKLDQSLEALVAAVRVTKPQKLEEIVPARTFTFYTMLQGVPQHDLYHAGQVMMLKKALRPASA